VLKTGVEVFQKTQIVLGNGRGAFKQFLELFHDRSFLFVIVKCRRMRKTARNGRMIRGSLDAGIAWNRKHRIVPPDSTLSWPGLACPGLSWPVLGGVRLAAGNPSIWRLARTG